MYTYHSHNTKYLHVPLSQYKTCTRNTVTIQNIYTLLQILMPTFRILVLRDVPPVGRYEVFKLARQWNKNYVETSDFAVAVFVM